MSEDGLRGRFLIALVWCGAATVIALELLGSLGQLRPVSVVTVGGGVVAVAVWWVIRGGWAAGPPAGARTIGVMEKVLASAIAVLLTATLVVALASPPNTWDSMTYHLSRVAHWFDQGSLEYYWTGIDRQLWQPPFAEYFIAAVYGAMGKRDLLVNLPQWIGGVGVLVGTSLIARRLAAPPRVQWMAAFFAAISPAFLLQSTSTQNDLVTGLWLVTVAYLVMVQWTSPGRQTSRVITLGLALGLAIGTKGTAIVLATPWVVGFVVADWRAHGARTGLGRAALIGLVALTLNAGPWLRSAAAFGSPLGPPSVHRLLRPAALGPTTVASNALASVSLHLGTPWPEANALLERGIRRLHRLAGADLQEMYPYFGGFRIVPWSTQEDLAGSPVHLVLGLAGLGLALGALRRIRPAVRAAILCLMGSCALLILAVRWQPYNGRLHLPIVMMASPLLALMVARWRSTTVAVVLAIAGLIGVPALFWNQSRPLLPDGRPSILAQPRNEARFNARPELWPTYRELVEEIRASGCREVGLMTAYDSWEYPLWAMTRDNRVRFRTLPPDRVVPVPDSVCLIVGLDLSSGSSAPAGYRRRWHAGTYAVWEPAGGIPR